MQAIVNTSPLISQTAHLRSDETCVIKIDMLDGTSQFVHLSLDQLPQVDATPDTNQTTSLNSLINYKLVQPSDLNLCVSHPTTIRTPLPRGRPKKRPKTKSNKVETAPKTPKIVKTSRTRSGRITRPPVTLERDFEKIITDAKAKSNDEEINTVQFEALHTKNTLPTEQSKEPVLVSLKQNAKKRCIPAQYRCKTCKKAYLGKAKMSNHLNKHPDHRLITPSNEDDCKTWSCLIETALKAAKGQRGHIFCREIITLIKNARTLVKYFFKTAREHNVEYEVDAFLAQILNIDEGLYRFNENELCKDLSIFSLLFFNEERAADEKEVEKEEGMKNSRSESNLFDFEAQKVENKSEFIQIFNADFIEKTVKVDGLFEKSDETLTESSEVARNGKELDIYRNTIKNIIDFGASDENMSSLMDKEKKMRKSDEFDLNKLHLDEFHFTDAPVHSLLDTSTGSDDIMNVDQFVNERFKKLTETEIVGDLPSGTLQLDLPALECFNFSS